VGRKRKKPLQGRAGGTRPGSGWVRFEHVCCLWMRWRDAKTVRPCPHPTQSGMAPGPGERASV